MFFGKCVEFCGFLYVLMDFKVKMLFVKEFQGWIKEMKNYKFIIESDLVKQGEELFKEKNCLSCYVVELNDKCVEVVRMVFNLVIFGERVKVVGVKDVNEENVKVWLKDFESVKLGNKMIGIYLKFLDSEIDVFYEYLKGLKMESKQGRKGDIGGGYIC